MLLGMLLLSKQRLDQTATSRLPKDKIKSGSDAGYEFLLSSDIDNSNPIVQAEMLNQLYYFMNWGQIVFGDKDKDAHFDGIRVDAVDNVSVDMLQLVSSYMKAAYKVNESEARALANISILEAWSQNDPYYVNNFGGFGQQGYGYNVKYLYSEIGKILGLEQDHNIIIIGAGNLGGIW